MMQYAFILYNPLYRQGFLNETKQYDKTVCYMQSCLQTFQCLFSGDLYNFIANIFCLSNNFQAILLNQYQYISVAQFIEYQGFLNT